MPTHERNVHRPVGPVVGAAFIVLALAFAAALSAYAIGKDARRASPSSVSPAPAYPAQSGPHGPRCYITLSGAVTEYVAMWLAEGQDCDTIAFAMQQEFYGATVTSDGRTEPWHGQQGNVACRGVLTSAEDPASVVTPDGTDPGGVCNRLGFN